MSLRAVIRTADHKTAYVSRIEPATPQPLAHDPKSGPGESDLADRIAEVTLQTPYSPSGLDATLKVPVQAPRSQDADPLANRGVTPTAYNGVYPIAHIGSTLQ